MLSDPSSALVVATIETEVIGYAAASMHSTLYANGPVAWIEELMVTETCRRAGIGRLLVAAVEDWVRSRGGVMIALATRRAATFWSSVGFEESASYFRRFTTDRGSEPVPHRPRMPERRTPPPSAHPPRTRTRP